MNITINNKYYYVDNYSSKSGRLFIELPESEWDVFQDINKVCCESEKWFCSFKNLGFGIEYQREGKIFKRLYIDGIKREYQKRKEEK